MGEIERDLILRRQPPIARPDGAATPTECLFYPLSLKTFETSALETAMRLKARNCATLLFLSIYLTAATFSQRRPVTIADSIESSAFGAPLDEALGNPLVIYSPKHDEFVVITRKGVIASNTNRSTLTIFRTGAGPDGMHPIHLFQMDSSSIYPAIDHVR